MTKDLNKPFVISSICRDDLAEKYDISAIDDATMEKLASKMANAYCDGSFWIDMEIFADDLDIPKKIK